MKPDLIWGTIDQGLDMGLEDLIALDWEEVEEGREDTPLAVNWSHYRRLEREGVLQAAFMVQGRQLLGYNVFFVHCPPHHSLTKWAVNDLIYLDPEHRQGVNGVRLIFEAEAHLKGLGAQLVIYGVKPDLSPAAERGSVGTLLQRLGYALFEQSYAKRI